MYLLVSPMISYIIIHGMKNIKYFTFIAPIGVILKETLTSCIIVRLYILQN